MAKRASGIGACSLAGRHAAEAELAAAGRSFRFRFPFRIYGVGCAAGRIRTEQEEGTMATPDLGSECRRRGKIEGLT